LSDGSVFTLRARADRIEEGCDGTWTIIDFKTGAVPSATDVFSGFAPKLTLQAAMLRRGSFGTLGPTAATPDLLYVHASGGRIPLAPKPVKPPRGETRTVADLVAEHERRLRELIERFVSGEAGFSSRPHPPQAVGSSPYDHLARVREWSLASAGEDAP
jgi:ATP-dependent helicase/nuclease subunit B